MSGFESSCLQQGVAGRLERLGKGFYCTKFGNTLAAHTTTTSSQAPGLRWGSPVRAMDEGCWVLSPRFLFWLPPEWQRGAALTDLLWAVWEPAASLSVLINLCQKRPAVTCLGVFYGSGSVLRLHVTLSRGLFFILCSCFIFLLSGRWMEAGTRLCGAASPSL